MGSVANVVHNLSFEWISIFQLKPVIQILAKVLV